MSSFSNLKLLPKIDSLKNTSSWIVQHLDSWQEPMSSSYSGSSEELPPYEDILSDKLLISFPVSLETSKHSINQEIISKCLEKWTVSVKNHNLLLKISTNF